AADAGPAFGDALEQVADFLGDHRARPPGALGPAMAAVVVDIDELRYWNVLGRFEDAALARRVELVLAVGKQQNARAYGPCCSGKIALEARRLPDVVALDRPAAIDPVARLHAVADRLRLLRIPRVDLVARPETILVARGRPADDALYLQPDADAGARRIVVRIGAV